MSGSFGGWATSDAGLGAHGFSYEIPCQVQGSYWEPNQMQLFVDNVRAMSLLPQPTEEHPHWFGLNPYTISVPGQQLLLRGLEWTRAGASGEPAATPSARERGETAPSEESGALPATGGPTPLVPLGVLGLAAVLVRGGSGRVRA